MKKVINRNHVPPGGLFIYRHEDGHEQSHPYFETLKNRVKEYRTVNQLPIGLQFDEQFEENICSRAHESVCVDYIPLTLVQKATQLAKSLARWAQSGFQVRSEETVSANRAICQSCEFYGGERGFLKILCCKCGCSSLKLYLRGSNCPLRKW